MKKTIFIVLLFTFSLIIFNLFLWVSFAKAESSNSSVISEVLINGPDGKEFIELYNPTNDAIYMDNWVLAYYSKTRDWSDPYRKKFFPAGSSIEPGEFFLISIKEGDYTEESDWGLGYSSYQLNNTDGAIGIFPDENFSEENTIDIIGWGEAKVKLFEGISAPSGKSLEKIDLSGDNSKENWRESCEDGGTPGKEPSEESCSEESPPDESSNDTEEDENSNDSGTEENTSNTGNVYLNEIFPNPKDGLDNEYIEVKNGGNKPTDLYGWKIKDASKGKGYQFKEHILLDPGDCFAVYRQDSKIALNNSNESVYLFNPLGEIASSILFEKSLKNASYGFDGKNWRWSKYLTPGKSNKFDSEPLVKVKKNKRAYRGIFTKFSAAAKDKETKKLKYTWDFGDGKKSYLAKTSHKYLATGKYTVTLSVSDESQSVEKRFTIRVKNYPQPDLEIVKIIPNPAGVDSDGEVLELKNNSKKNVELDGWKIATGSGEKTYNHPVREGVVLDPGETKTITREISKFTLNNKSGKVQLVSLDGKIVDEVEYTKEKIAEGEAYLKIDGEWHWAAPSIKEELAKEEESGEEDKINNDGEVLGATDENIPTYVPVRTGYTSEDEFIFYQALGFLNSGNQGANSCSADDYSFSIAYLLASII